MKIWELSTGLLTILSEEENTLLQKIIKEGNGPLTEREEVVAHRLVQKDILVREDEDGCETYKVNWNKDLWRD